MENEVFQQNLSQSEQAGAVFIIKLLFKEPVKLPPKEQITEVLKKHTGGEVDCYAYDNESAGVSVKKYVSHFKDADVPPLLLITSCSDFDGEEIDGFARSQFWDCEDSDRVLSECKYQVIATDMCASGLSSKERAELDMDFAEALAELYPKCEAVLFLNSGKLFHTEALINHGVPKEDRFIKFAVNARFFNIQGTDDMIVDTLGMSTLFLPDLQYHFHGMDPNIIVNRAYCTASYILMNENPIEDGDPIDAAMADGSFSRRVQWKCRYEEALIQPAREVLDVFANEYAAGKREQKEL